MNKLKKIIIGLAVAMVLTISIFASDKSIISPDPAWVLTLGGAGNTSTTGNDGTAFGIDIGIGRTGHLLLPTETGIRQSISYNDSTTLLTTKLYNDWTILNYKRLDIFGGANIGIRYGNTTAQWEFAPEVGTRYWLKNDVNIIARLEFPFDLGNSFDYKDTLRYILGLQLKF